MKKEAPTDEQLIDDIANHNVDSSLGKRRHWAAQLELQRRIAERAGAPSLFWSKIAAIAAIVGVVLGALALLK